jgi:hypothetical protein
MAALGWDEFTIVALFALCVLGPICVVLLTQNLLGPVDDADQKNVPQDGFARRFGERDPAGEAPCGADDVADCGPAVRGKR